MTFAIAAGVDVGRDYLDVAFAPSGKPFRSSNTPKGVEVVVDRLKRLGVGRVVLESMGTYASRLVRALSRAGLDVRVVDPKRIRALRLVEGRQAKTDRLDAQLIARFALLMSDAARPLPSAESLEIRALSTRRRQLVEMAAMEKTRLKQTLDEEIAESCRAMIALLEAERDRVEKQLKARLLAQPDGAERFRLLQSAPGVGPAVAMTLMADLPELGQTDRRAIASLAGLAPHPDDSGLRTGRDHIRGGRSCVRTALYMAAVTAARSNKGFKAEYKAMRAAGKPAKVALIAIARKLLIALNGMARDNTEWAKPA
jgi:transposase